MLSSPTCIVCFHFLSALYRLLSRCLLPFSCGLLRFANLARTTGWILRKRKRWGGRGARAEARNKQHEQIVYLVEQTLLHSMFLKAKARYSISVLQFYRQYLIEIDSNKNAKRLSISNILRVHTCVLCRECRSETHWALSLSALAHFR